jgi:GNAT superfamily N-acetyltransferase
VKASNISATSTPGYVGAFWHGITLQERGVAEASDMGDYWYVNRVLVQPPDQRGSGIGQQLVKRLLNEIRLLGGRKVIVTPGGYGSNTTQQINFYKKCGFTEDKDAEGPFLYKKLRPFGGGNSPRKR